MSYYYKDAISNNLKKQITYYYKELYENYETKSVLEIADELGISYETIYMFINSYCDCSSYKMNYSSITVMIMVCTKFNKKNKFYEIQQERFSELIRKRQLLKEIKIRNENLIEKRKLKSYQK